MNEVDQPARDELVKRKELIASVMMNEGDQGQCADRHPASDVPFLEVRVRDLTLEPSLRGLCVGYENGVWRNNQFAQHVIKWLPDFALDHAERRGLGAHDAAALLGKAAISVYTSGKYRKRGEFGEILLHMALRQDCGSLPAISKIYFKSAANDTVKGFDAVHVVSATDGLELWLGEVKFYDKITRAISDVAAELSLHTQVDYLRQEFLWIGNKLNATDPHAKAIREMLHPHVSLDKIFKRLCFPVLLTYDSACVAAHTACTREYEAAFNTEVRQHYQALVARRLPANLRIHVILLPLHSKATLITELDRRLKQCQDL